MKRVADYLIMAVLLLYMLPVQALAGDVRLERAAVMRDIDMELYEFYTDLTQGLELCCRICPEYAAVFENASGTFSVLLEDAVLSIRNEHYEIINFSEYDAALLDANKQEYSLASGCTPCLSLAEKVQTYSQEGLPQGLAQTALFHAEKYRVNPEQEFNDGLVSTVKYQWRANGKKRTCRISIPKTWGKAVAQGGTKKAEYRSAFGNGIPFFSIQYQPAQHVRTDDAIMKELQRRVSIGTLEKQYGDVELLAQGVQRLGKTQSIWVMFSTKGSENHRAGFYYNWYMLVDGTVLVFESGVSGKETIPAFEQEAIFRKYYETLREIAVSSVIG